MSIVENVHCKSDNTKITRQPKEHGSSVLEVEMTKTARGMLHQRYRTQHIIHKQQYRQH